MAKDESFDIVSQVDMQEVDNAVQQTDRQIAQRFDLKDTKSEVTLDKSAATILVKAPSDFVARQVIDILGSVVVKRGIDLKALAWGNPEAASGGWVRMTATIVNGIEDTLAKKINKVAVVSGVCWGFIGNRMLQPRQVGANALLMEGARRLDEAKNARKLRTEVQENKL